MEFEYLKHSRQIKTLKTEKQVARNRTHCLVILLPF